MCAGRLGAGCRAALGWWWGAARLERSPRRAVACQPRAMINPGQSSTQGSYRHADCSFLHAAGPGQDHELRDHAAARRGPVQVSCGGRLRMGWGARAGRCQRAAQHAGRLGAGAALPVCSPPAAAAAAAAVEPAACSAHPCTHPHPMPVPPLHHRGGAFLFSFAVPSGYPHDPPKVKCLTKVGAGRVPGALAAACTAAAGSGCGRLCAAPCTPSRLAHLLACS